MTIVERAALWLRNKLRKYEVVVKVTDPNHYQFGKIGVITLIGQNAVYVKLQDAEYVQCLNGFVSEPFFNSQVKRVS